MNSIVPSNIVEYLAKSPPFAVIESINKKKGGPRTSLYDLCKKVQWTMPTFDTTETKSRFANSTSYFLVAQILVYIYTKIISFPCYICFFLHISRSN